MDLPGWYADGHECLRTVNLSKCTNLEHVAALDSCTLLTKLYMNACMGMCTIDALAYCSGLTFLDLSCLKVSSVAPLAKLTVLVSLNVADSHKLLDISTLVGSTSLDSITTSSMWPFHAAV